VRRTGRNYVQTIKTTGRGLLDRNEWETGFTDEKPDFGAMRHTALEPLLTKKLRRRLRPVFETRVRRTTYPLEVRDRRSKWCWIAAKWLRATGPSRCARSRSN
jgi:inorganic triphosphatase YgiF